jgi:3-phosphoshikimate 1-carboxyvinyltransferase
MGGRIEVTVREEFPEPLGDVTVHHSRLRGIRIGGTEIPLIIDEIPALAVCAMFARGETVITGAGELRIKESDRIHGIVHMVRAFGGRVEELEDGLVIGGGARTSPGEVQSYDDHRIAMASSVLACATRGGGTIRNAGCVEISFPDFFETLDRCTGGVK